MTRLEEISMHVLAQMTRFVVRGTYTEAQAASLARNMAKALINEEEQNRIDADEYLTRIQNALIK